MKKTAVVFAIVLFIAIISYGVYAYIKKAKSQNSKVLPLPDGPPGNMTVNQGGGPGQPNGDGKNPGGLYSTDDGDGFAAITKRMNDIINKTDILKTQVIPSLNTLSVMDGVLYSSGFFLSNIIESIGSANADGLPYILNNQQREAINDLSKLKYLDTAQNFWYSLLSITNAAKEIQLKSGVRIFNKDMYSQNLNPIKNDYIIKTVAGGAGLKEAYSEKAVIEATKLAIADMNQFAKNWLSLANSAYNAVKEIAINDLRSSGWKFIGYDKPV